MKLFPLLALASAIFLAGCALGTSSPEAISTPLGAITGSIHGGRQPVSGAHVYVYAAGTTGYGSASTSLLTAFNTGSFPTALDGSNKYYVTTNGSGGFTLTGEYTCVPGTQIYLYSSGGDPGSGSANSAAGFLAVLGQCPPSGSMATVTPNVIMNEVSTVAAAYAFAGFAADATHVGSSGTALAQVGIANAFANAVNLFDISGTLGIMARALPAYVGGSAPQSKVDALANALASCVNSTGPASTQCSALFTNIKSAGSSGTAATDTATEAIFIAHNPATAVSTIFNNPTGIGTPFVPTLSSPPNDWTLEVNIYTGSLGFPDAIAVDASGNVWITCYDSTVNKYSPVGKELSVSPYTGGGLSNPTAIAIDTSGNAWVANNGGVGVVTELGPTGAPVNAHGFAGNGNLNPYGIAIDASGFIWVSNFSKSTLSKMDTSGTEVSGSPFPLVGLGNPANIAIDHSGNAWVGTYGSATIVKATTTGATASGSPFSSGAYNSPRSLAVNASGGVWVGNEGDTTFTRTTSAGVGSNLAGTTGGLQYPNGVIVDGDGNVWFIDKSANQLSEFSGAGAAITPSTGYQSPNFNQPFALAIDGSGNVWVVNGNGDTLSLVMGAAAPTITPIVTTVINNTFGTRP